ncbi:MAG: preprotein translocase subunit Sec61beta [Promethearchaeota archaeon]
MAKKESRRARRRSSRASMPMGGAGLIRFYQDESSKVKIGPVATLLIAVALIVLVILGWIFAPL